MRVAKVISLTEQERVTLTTWARGRSTPKRLVLRAQIVLAAADGRENQEIAAEFGCTRRTVGSVGIASLLNVWRALNTTRHAVTAPPRFAGRRKPKSFTRRRRKCHLMQRSGRRAPWRAHWE